MTRELGSATKGSPHQVAGFLKLPLVEHEHKKTGRCWEVNRCMRLLKALDCLCIVGLGTHKKVPYVWLATEKKEEDVADRQLINNDDTSKTNSHDTNSMLVNDGVSISSSSCHSWFRADEIDSRGAAFTTEPSVCTGEDHRVGHSPRGLKELGESSNQAQLRSSSIFFFIRETVDLKCVKTISGKDNSLNPKTDLEDIRRKLKVKMEETNHGDTNRKSPEFITSGVTTKKLGEQHKANGLTSSDEPEEGPTLRILPSEFPYSSGFSSVKSGPEINSSRSSGRDHASESSHQDCRGWSLPHAEMNPVFYTGATDKNGQPHGEGFIRFDNQDNYAGSFRHGRMHGKGIYVWQDGTVFKGVFQHGLQHGHGEFRMEGDKRYIGNFEVGHPHGHGEAYHSDGSLFFKGTWEYGKPAHTMVPFLRGSDDESVASSQFQIACDSFSVSPSSVLPSGSLVPPNDHQISRYA